MERFDLRLWTGFQAAGGDPSQPAFVDQIAIHSRRIDSKNALFVALKGNVHDGHKFIGHAARCGARFALVDRVWEMDDPVNSSTRGCSLLHVDNPLKAFQEIAAAYRKQFACKIIGIAGSYGKTMVKDLLQAMLSTTFSVVASPESFNSQIGVPLSLLTIGHAHQIALIEAAISKKGEMEALNAMIGAEYAIITHIGKKHLATLDNLETITSETLQLLRLPPQKQWAILPKDPNILSQFSPSDSHHYYWTENIPHLPHASFISDEQSAKMSYKVVFPKNNGYVHFGQITSGFYYFLDLINITVKAAWLLGVGAEAISATLKSYTPEPMRMEIWKSSTGTTFINDAYCSDPQSVDKALTFLTRSTETSRKIMAFGGMRGVQQHHDSAYRRIGQAIHRAQIDLLYLFGPHRFDPLIDEIKLLQPKIELHVCASYKEALQHMKTRADPEDEVLIKGDRKHSIDQLMQVFDDSIASNHCWINLAAIASNLETIRKKLPLNMRIMVMVKALAYGTDGVRISKFLESCHIDILGVSFVDEGVALKRAGVSQSIFVIQAAAYEAYKVVKWGLEIGVSDQAMIEAVGEEAIKQNKKIKVHLHIDTGMGRFGCREEEALELAKLILSYPLLELEGVMTHFACADDPSQDAFTLQQAHSFERTLELLRENKITPRWCHAANSSGAIRFHFPQFNMVRIGLAVYGLYSSQAVQKELELRLAISLTTRIVGINHCKEGETVSYGRSYRVQRGTQRIAVLPIGYFDGLHCSYSGKGAVIIHGQKVPMIGKICMDFMMIDITDIPNATIGDPVLVFGEDEHGQYLSPEQLATQGDSIIHELITCLGPRIQRIFVHEESRNAH